MTRLLYVFLGAALYAAAVPRVDAAPDSSFAAPRTDINSVFWDSQSGWAVSLMPGVDSSGAFVLKRVTFLRAEPKNPNHGDATEKTCSVDLSGPDKAGAVPVIKKALEACGSEGEIPLGASAGAAITTKGGGQP